MKSKKFSFRGVFFHTFNNSKYTVDDVYNILIHHCKNILKSEIIVLVLNNEV